VGSNTSALTFTTLEGSVFYANPSAFGSGDPFYTNLSAGYQTLLQSSVYWDLSDTSVVNRITLNDLVSGNTYYVQLWVNDSRNDYGDRVNLVSDGDGHEIQLRFNDGTGTPSLGQYVTGTFIASGTTQDLLLSADSGNTIQLNALTLSTSAIPEPSTYAVLAGLAALGCVILRRRG
jgi:PEP-CTERM motif